MITTSYDFVGAESRAVESSFFNRAWYLMHSVDAGILQTLVFFQNIDGSGCSIFRKYQASNSVKNEWPVFKCLQNQGYLFICSDLVWFVSINLSFLAIATYTQKLQSLLIAHHSRLHRNMMSCCYFFSGNMPCLIQDALFNLICPVQFNMASLI